MHSSGDEAPAAAPAASSSAAAAAADAAGSDLEGALFGRAREKAGQETTNRIGADRRKGAPS